MDKENFSIKLMCKVFKVDEKLNKLIEIIFIQSRQTFGTRRIKDKLVERYGVVVSRRRIRNITKGNGCLGVWIFENGVVGVLKKILYNK